MHFFVSCTACWAPCWHPSCFWREFETTSCALHFSIPLPVSLARWEHRPLPPLGDWRPTLFRGHQDVLQWSCRLGCHALRTSPQRDSSNFGWITFSVRSPFFARMLLDSTRFLGAGNLHGGCQNVSRRAVHAMVRGAVSDTLKIHETAVVSAPHGPIFTGESGAARIHSGPSGKIVWPIFPA